jgi:hypothetical protein
VRVRLRTTIGEIVRVLADADIGLATQDDVGRHVASRLLAADATIVPPRTQLQLDALHVVELLHGDHIRVEALDDVEHARPAGGPPHDRLCVLPRARRCILFLERAHVLAGALRRHQLRDHRFLIHPALAVEDVSDEEAVIGEAIGEEVPVEHAQAKTRR